MTVLYTTVTSIMAFIFGMYAPQYAVKGFSLQCALSLAFNLIYLLTFFVAFMGYDITRQNAGMGCCACCCCGTACNHKGSSCGLAVCGVFGEATLTSIHDRFEVAALADIEEKVLTKEELISSPGFKVLLYPVVKAGDLDNRHNTDEESKGSKGKNTITNSKSRNIGSPASASPSDGGRVGVVPVNKVNSLTLDSRGAYSTLEILFEGSHESTNRVTAMTIYATCLMHTVVKVLVILLFVAITMVSAYIVRYELKPYFPLTATYPDVSYMRDFVNLAEQLTPQDTGTDPTRVAEMMYRVVDYHKQDVQAALDTHRDKSLSRKSID